MPSRRRTRIDLAKGATVTIVAVWALVCTCWATLKIFETYAQTSGFEVVTVMALASLTILWAWAVMPGAR